MSNSHDSTTDTLYRDHSTTENQGSADRPGTALMVPSLPVVLVNGAVAVLLSLGVPYALEVLLRAFTGGE